MFVILYRTHSRGDAVIGPFASLRETETYLETKGFKENSNPGTGNRWIPKFSFGVEPDEAWILSLRPEI